MTLSCDKEAQSVLRYKYPQHRNTSSSCRYDAWFHAVCTKIYLFIHMPQSRSRPTRLPVFISQPLWVAASVCFLKLAEVRAGFEFSIQSCFCSAPVLWWVATWAGFDPPLNHSGPAPLTPDIKVLWPTELLWLLIFSCVSLSPETLEVVVCESLSRSAIFKTFAADRHNATNSQSSFSFLYLTLTLTFAMPVRILYIELLQHDWLSSFALNYRMKFQVVYANFFVHEFFLIFFLLKKVLAYCHFCVKTAWACTAFSFFSPSKFQLHFQAKPC